MQAKTIIALGALLAAISVGTGAFGAHALKTIFDSKQLDLWQTAVLYQAIHSLGLVVIGLAGLFRPAKIFQVSACLMLVGILLFSGSLYTLAYTQIKTLGMITPIGGVSFILAWLGLALGAIKDLPKD